MGSSLGPILANTIMTELEKKIVKPMIESELLKFHMRYADDTLLLAKEDDINYIFGKFNSFHKNLKKKLQSNLYHFKKTTRNKQANN